jgi:hypothetical protein
MRSHLRPAGPRPSCLMSTAPRPTSRIEDLSALARIRPCLIRLGAPGFTVARFKLTLPTLREADMALSKERMDQIRSDAEKIKDASKALTDSVLTLWRAQLDMALTMEDEALIRAMMAQQPPNVMPRYMDHNCSCGHGPHWGGRVGNGAGIRQNPPSRVSQWKTMWIRALSGFPHASIYDA